MAGCGDNPHNADALRRSEERFRKIFEASNDAVLIIDPDQDRILDANRRACRLLGYTRDEILRVPVSAIHPREMPRLRAFARAVTEAGEGWTDELTCLTRSGESVPAEISASVIDFPEGRFLVSCVRDLREVHRLRRRIDEAERLAAFGQFGTFIAHQINTPLTNIALLTATIAREIQDPGIREKLGRIDAQRRLMSDIIADLLRFARHPAIAPTTQDLRELLGSAMEQVLSYRKPDVAIDLRLGEQPAMAPVDGVQMREAFVNLLKNALEFTARGSVEVKIASQERLWMVEISDTGPGIPPDRLARIFEPLFTTKQPGEGTGLGLTFAKLVVEAHGGEIRVASQVGVGSTFTVVIPKAESTERAL